MHVTLNTGHVTPAGLWWATGHDLDDPDIRAMIDAGQKPMIGGASIGNAVENKVLDHLVANATYTAPTPSLGLWTSTVDDTSTAATAGELTYTTYARQSISSTNMSPAASGSVTNDVAITFAAVTAGGGTVTFWMLCSPPPVRATTSAGAPQHRRSSAPRRRRPQWRSAGSSSTSTDSPSSRPTSREPPNEHHLRQVQPTDAHHLPLCA
jgi:hypothetical protein